MAEAGSSIGIRGTCCCGGGSIVLERVCLWSSSSCSGRAGWRAQRGSARLCRLTIGRCSGCWRYAYRPDDQTNTELEGPALVQRFVGLALDNQVGSDRSGCSASSGPRCGHRWLFSARCVAGLVSDPDGGQIVDATVIQARRPRLTRSGEGDAIKGWRRALGLVEGEAGPNGYRGPLAPQRGRESIGSSRASPRRARSDLVIPVFGYNNYLGIDRRHGFIRSFAVTDAARPDGRQLDRLLDPHPAVGHRPTPRTRRDVGLLARAGW